MPDVLNSTTLSDITDGMRSQRANLIREESEIQALYDVRLPIIRKQRDTIEKYLQGMGEAVDFETKLKEERKEDFELIQSRLQRQTQVIYPSTTVRPTEQDHDPDDPTKLQRPYSKRGPYNTRSHPRVESPIAKPVYHRPDLFRVTDDIVLHVAAILEKNGAPMKGGAIYQKMVELRHIKPLPDVVPAKTFAIALSKYDQDLVVYYKPKLIWGTPQQFRMSQAEIKVLRESRRQKETKAIIKRTATLREHFNDAKNGHAKPSVPAATIDPTEDPFVVCLNCIFRDQRNQPIGATQLWEVIKDDNIINLTGVKTYDEFKARLTGLGAFFAQEPGSKAWYPLHPYPADPRITVKTATGELLPIY
jgi:hypothetical protein